MKHEIARWRMPVTEASAQHDNDGAYGPFFFCPQWRAALRDIYAADIEEIFLGRAAPALFLGVKRHWSGARIAFVNETGNASIDRLFVERNDFSFEKTPDSDQRIELIREMLARCDNIDCLVVRRADAALFESARAAAPSSNWSVRQTKVTPSFSVSLDDVRNKGGDYIATRNRNTRQRLRRAWKLESQSAPLEVIESKTAEDRKKAWADLVALNLETWRARGKATMFDDKRFLRFHEILVEDTRSPVSLLSIQSGPQLIGVLYLFMKNNSAHYYQSGFRRAEDNRHLPGFVCHAAAIQHFAAHTDLRSYDFLSGQADYKARLGDEGPPLVSFRIEKNTLPARFYSAGAELRSAARRWIRDAR